MADLSAKRLQLLKEAIPRLTRVAVLWNPATPYHPKVVDELKAVAPSLAIELSFVGARTPEEFGPAFSAISGAHAQALYVLDDAQFVVHRRTLLKLASKAPLPVVYSQRNFPDAGALIHGLSAKGLAHFEHASTVADLSFVLDLAYEFAAAYRTAGSCSGKQHLLGR